MDKGMHLIWEAPNMTSGKTINIWEFHPAIHLLGNTGGLNGTLTTVIVLPACALLNEKNQSGTKYGKMIKVATTNDCWLWHATTKRIQKFQFCDPKHHIHHPNSLLCQATQKQCMIIRLLLSMIVVPSLMAALRDPWRKTFVYDAKV